MQAPPGAAEAGNLFVTVALQNCCVRRILRETMPKFYFKVIDREGTLPADEPYEFADIVEASEQARLALTEMATDGLPNPPTNMLAIEVQDEDHRPLIEMRLVLEILSK